MQSRHIRILCKLMSGNSFILSAKNLMFISSRGESAAEPIVKNTVRGAILASTVTFSCSTTAVGLFCASAQLLLQAQVSSCHLIHHLTHIAKFKLGDNLWYRTIESTSRETIGQTKCCTDNSVEIVLAQ